VELWIGIDVGKRSHHACAVDHAGSIVWSRRIDNDQTSVEELLRAVDTSNVRWAVDLTSAVASLLLTLLVAAEQQVVYVPGRVVHALASAYRGEGKTDAKDARLIADIARTRADFDVVQVPDPLVINLRQLTSYRADLVTDRVRTVNRLRDLLNSIFPALETELRFLGTSALLLLSTFCTAAEVRDAGEVGLDMRLANLGVRSDRRRTVVAAALAAAQRQSCVIAGEDVTAALIKRLAQRLLAIDTETRELDHQIETLFRQHRYARALESIPGIGAQLGAEFLRWNVGRVRHRRPPRRVRRPRPCSPRLRPHHRQPSATPAVQPESSANVLSRSTIQPGHRRTLAAVLPAQTRAEQGTHPGTVGCGAQTSRCRVGSHS
jgi:transposase